MNVHLGLIGVIRMLIVAIHLETTLVNAEMVFLEMVQSVTVINMHAYYMHNYDTFV